MSDFSLSHIGNDDCPSRLPFRILGKGSEDAD